MTAFATRLLLIEIFFEGLTGALLVAVPETILRWLFGDPPPLDATLARVAGAGLLVLASGCGLLWQRKGAGAAFRVFLGYNVLATILLLAVGLAMAYAGVLLWPAVAVHVVLTALVAAALARRSYLSPR